MRRLSFLRKFTSKVGFSDHTKVKDTNLLASKIALAMGADVIERHFTILDKSQTRDGPVSINPSQVKELKKLSSLSKEDLKDYLDSEYPDFPETFGIPERDLSHSELLNRDYYRGRFWNNLGSNQSYYNWENAP